MNLRLACIAALSFALTACSSSKQSVLDPAQKRLENLEEESQVERVKPIQSAASEVAPPQRHLNLSPECLEAYQKLYENSTVDIRVAFGYKDARPARFVGDRYERIVFIQHLVAPCRGDYFACGFRRDSDDADLLIKTIAGPDGFPRRIELRVTHSSAGPDDEDNRQNTFQRWQSRHSQRNFLKGLESADVVFYNGHSRDGGGPDFQPPRLTKNSHVDYGWYMRNQPGVKNMIEALRDSEQSPKALGLFSCVSGKHFSKRVKQNAPEMALITSQRLLYYADAIASSLGALNAMLGMWCESAFQQAIQAHPDRKDSKLDGFFTAAKAKPSARPDSKPSARSNLEPSTPFSSIEGKAPASNNESGVKGFE